MGASLLRICDGVPADVDTRTRTAAVRRASRNIRAEDKRPQSFMEGYYPRAIRGAALREGGGAAPIACDSVALVKIGAALAGFAQQNIIQTLTTPSAPFMRRLRTVLLMAQPPLL